MNDKNLFAPLQINADLARKIIVEFIRQEVTRVGFEKGIIAMSGGVDSSLVAVLAVEALGRENVHGILMPYRTSNPDSRSDAEEVARQLRIDTRVIDITPMVEPYLVEHVGDNDRRRGNVMARTRMIVLYDQSEAFGGLVIGTSNKTEALLGYTTLFGDSASALQPIEDLYKTQVRQLARALDLPKPVIEKPPSADLWIGQTDEDELGYTYEEVDKALYLLVEGRYTIDEAAEQGFERAFLEGVWRRVRMNHFKRTMPNVAKLSRRSIGHDFLYLRDWGSL